MDIKLEEVIALANALLDHASVPRHVSTIKQCNSTLFSQLYEALTGSKVPGIVSQGPTSESVKCQAVVNALNRHLAPHVNLDHIRGVDLAALDLLAMRNLLDIFSVLFHLPRTFDSRYDELEGSELEENDEGGYREESVMNDSNLISNEGLSVISEVLNEELGGHMQDSTSTDSTTELLRPVPRAKLPPRVAQMNALQGHYNQSQPKANNVERNSSSSHSSEQPPSLSISNIHSTGTEISSSSCEAGGVISQVVEEPAERRMRPSEVTPATASAQPSTPPQTPQHRHHLIKSPLHHSTPHTSTRSRVFHGDRNTPAFTQARMPTLNTLEPTQETASHTTPQTVPRSTSTAGRMKDREDDNAGVPDDSTLLQAEGSTVLPESSHSEAPDLIITDLHTTTLQDTNISHHDTPPHPRREVTNVSTSSSISEHSSAEEDAEPLSAEYRSRLDARAAQARATVLATLYQNYLSELKAAKPHKAASSKAKHSKTHGRNKSKPSAKHSKASHSRTPLTSVNQEERDKDTDRPRTPTQVSVGDNLMPLIEREFPFIHVSPSTMHRLMQRQIQQVQVLTKTSEHSQKSSAVKKINEMELRYKTLLQVIKKELEHTKRMQKRHELQQEKKKAKSSVSAKRQAAARSRRYFNEYELRLRAKMQRRRTREEQVFKRAFEEGLELQRERVRELRKYTREKQEEYAKRHQDQLESMENYYHDQFAMLVESTAREREEAAVRERAQHKAVCRMKHELRKKIEDEIKQLQENIDREEDIIHFRELDSEQLRHKLSHLTFTAAV